MDTTSIDLVSVRIREIEHRISSIDRRFAALLEDNKAEAKSFDNVLDKKIEKIKENEQTEEEKKQEFDDDVDFKKASLNTNSNNTEISKLVEKYSKQNNLSEELIKAVIQTESSFNPNAKSPAGALGLMQLMPSTAESLGVIDPLNPEENISGGTKYLRKLINRYDSVELGLAAYNAGPGNVNKYGGIPPYKETQNYVKKVLEIQNSLDDQGR